VLPPPEAVLFNPPEKTLTHVRSADRLHSERFHVRKTYESLQGEEEEKEEEEGEEEDTKKKRRQCGCKEWEADKRNACTRE
jgi:hypothetical protein